MQPAQIPKMGAHDSILRLFLLIYALLAPQRGPWHHAPPKYAPTYKLDNSNKNGEILRLVSLSWSELCRLNQSLFSQI